MERSSMNVSLLQNFGLSNKRIVMFILSKPSKISVDPKLLESRLSYVDEKLGISRESPVFITAVSAVLWRTDSEIEKKMQIFRGFGWSDSEIATLFGAQPYYLSKSKAYISDKLNLEKRIKPRNAVLKILKEKELVKDAPSFGTIVSYSELKFLDFVQSYESRVPGLCETYMNRRNSERKVGSATLKYLVSHKEGGGRSLWLKEKGGLWLQETPNSIAIMFRFSTLFRSHRLFYSTIDANRKPHLLVDYLMDSLHFSKKDAISISTKAKLTHLKSTINSDIVLNIFKTYGLDLPQIRRIVSSAPKILTCKPKIRFFHQLGLSGSDLVTFIKNNPHILRTGLHTKIIPCLGLLRQLLGSDEIVIQVINRSRRLSFTNSFMERLSTNVSLLKNFGLSNERIVRFLLTNPPSKINVDPNQLESRLSYVQEKLGISRESPIFVHALSAVLWYTDSEIERKMQNFRSFGWSDSDIALLFMNQPYCLTMSEANMLNKLNFYMKDLGYTPSYLMARHSFFTLSLDKRVIPRNTMLKILREKKLVSSDKPSLNSIATYSESKFLEFLRRFEEDVPCLRKIYLDSVKRVVS
ncbi:hypothetical protein OSB04_024800 [Centaurea solstitialis]|uniref:Uncharacterized protein n=1 Tax=Centaurea solstitialis TaxID=347529 RepID=A0AA38T6A2_9ASTR|nr:hypothetical protein OSB04_024800 [Centaurea solstitialis]